MSNALTEELFYINRASLYYIGYIYQLDIKSSLCQLDMHHGSAENLLFDREFV